MKALILCEDPTNDEFIVKPVVKRIFDELRRKAQVHAVQPQRSDLPSWKQIRGDCDVKERYAVPFLERRGFKGPGKGRSRAMERLSGNWRGLLRRCPEIRNLKDQIEEVLRRR